jgi:PIN domain nuclease of toxin-antitoxin system
VRVLADSHAIVWHLQGSARLSALAASALTEAEATDGVIVSITGVSLVV